MLPVNDESLCFVCRMCKHMERAADKMPEGSVVRCNVEGCNGPLVGCSFSKYEGPLKGYMLRQCYRCGADADGHLTAGDGGMLGVCERCAKILVEFQK